MLALRVLGGALAVFLLISSVPRYRNRRISRLNLIITWILAGGILILAIAPDVFDFAFDAFNFQKGGGDRLVAVLLAAVIILFLLVWRAQSYIDTNERAIRLLVEQLSVQAFDWSKEADLPPHPRVVTVSPAYNEAENVAGVLDPMPKQVKGYNVISVVVSDASEDGTEQVARQHGAYVARLPIRRGGGLALRVGYDIALRLDADIVVTLDADGQHLPQELGVMIEPLITDEADYVNGSRLLGVFERESFVRYLGVHFFSWMATVLTGTRITDISSGYRAARADLLKKLVLEEDQFWTSEILIEALRNHARIKEVPITIEARKGGKSKKPKTMKYAWNFTKAMVQTWLR